MNESDLGTLGLFITLTGDKILKVDDAVSVNIAQNWIGD